MTELHRPLPVERIGSRGMDFLVEADVAECAAVAARMGIPAVHALSCRFALTPGLGGRIDATGRLRARVTRICVLSLDEFAAPVAEDFTIVFVPEDQLADTGEDPETIDELPYGNGRIDLGEAAVEQLALALEPYPRKPGATLAEEAGEGTPHPFAGLAALKRPN